MVKMTSFPVVQHALTWENVTFTSHFVQLVWSISLKSSSMLRRKCIIIEFKKFRKESITFLKHLCKVWKLKVESRKGMFLQTRKTQTKMPWFWKDEQTNSLSMHVKQTYFMFNVCSLSTFQILNHTNEKIHLK